jgi:hypothetical protein
MMQRLRQVAAQCRASADEGQVWLGEAITKVLDDWAAGERVSLDEALGLNFNNAIAQRNHLIRESYDCLGSISEIDKRARRLQRLNAALRPPKITLDNPERLIAEALELGVPFPKKRQIYKILDVQ